MERNVTGEGGGSDLKLHFTFHRRLLIIIKDRNEHIPDMRNLMESLCTLVCSSAEKTVDLHQHRQGKNGL